MRKYASEKRDFNIKNRLNAQKRDKVTVLCSRYIKINY